MLNRRRFLQGSVVLAAASAMLRPPSRAAAQAAARRSVQAPGYFRLTVGEVEVTALYDGVINVSPGLLRGVKPRDLAVLLEDAFLDPKTDFPVPVSAFLVNTGRNLVLVDAGAGALPGLGTGLLPENLRAAGYAPDEIDTVLLTHLHMDHALGVADGDGRAVFPRAVVRVGQADAAYWLSDELAAASSEKVKRYLKSLDGALAPYIADGRFKPFAPGETPVDGVEAVPLPGHTPGHHGFRVVSKERRLLVWGDVMHNAAVQFPKPETAIDFDLDRPWAASTRKVLLSELATGRDWVAGAHLPFPGVGRIRAKGKAYVWVPAEYGVPAAG